MRTNNIYVRVRKGNKVIEDLLLPTAIKQTSKGWIIEDTRYDERGNPKEIEKEPTKEVVEDLGNEELDTIAKMRKATVLKRLKTETSPELIEALNNRLNKLK